MNLQKIHNLIYQAMNLNLSSLFVGEKWKLDALDKFMKDCGDATQYTATVSQYFTISELISLKRLMFAHDIRRILQMAHQQYDLTKKTHWLHSEKWVKHCDVCKSTNELTPGIKIKQM